MAAPALSEELVELWSDRKWRLNNLYYIENKYGEVVRFTLNDAQSTLLDELHFLNIILKARQMGFSTFILILALDCCIFNDHFSAGLIADTLDNAKNLLDRIKFSYERMPEQIKAAVQMTKCNETEIEFSNHSDIEVGVSLRSTTKNFLHVSEYGKICAKDPKRAKEVKSGALNTLAPRQLGFIESTAEGQDGDFFDKCEASRAILDAGREPTDLEYKFHFFAWWQDSTYQTDVAVRIPHDLQVYFAELETEYGITLTKPQMWWYTAKAAEQGEDMWKEYPSTPEEAFKAAKDGAYFAKEIRALRQRKKIGQFPADTRTVVNTFWDLGVSDSTIIWLHQLIGGRHRFVGFYENSGEGIAHYIDWLNKWSVRNGCVFGYHYGPHDVEARKQGENAESIKDIAERLGFRFEVVERSLNKNQSIQRVRTTLPECEFDEEACLEGVKHLENYSKEWDETHGRWKDKPRHDKHSHAADAFMTFADGYEVPKPEPETLIPEYGTIA
ncbi:MAG: terminase [Sphingomonadales bacterium]|nr:MAG: terminase [Sphingomonadales bacterium]